MTRENKLALILGFGLILVVGILVSDHLSAASRQEPADLAGRASQREERFARSDSLAPVEIDGRVSQQPRVRIRPTPAATNGTHMGYGPGGRSMGEPSDTPGGGSGLMQDVNDTTTGAASSQEQTLREIRNPDLQSEEFRPRPPDAQPVSFQWYTIKSGETLSKIAERFYGESNMWRKLAEFNKDRIPNPDRVPAGVTIRIPTRESLTGEPAATRTAGAQQPPATQQPTPKPPQPRAQQQQFTTYTIQSGDTLGTISQKTLGTSRRYMEIYEFNKDVLSSPDDIRVGTTIRIPKSA